VCVCVCVCVCGVCDDDDNDDCCRVLSKIKSQRVLHYVADRLRSLVYSARAINKKGCDPNLQGCQPIKQVL
jgi:hypothetical protein